MRNDAWEPRCMKNGVIIHGHAWPCKSGGMNVKGICKGIGGVVWREKWVRGPVSGMGHNTFQKPYQDIFLVQKKGSFLEWYLKIQCMR